MSGIFVTGTDTGVGKTVVTGALVLALRARGFDAAACKPVQSGAPLADPEGDAALLARWTDDDPATVCALALAAALAPSVAAEREGSRVDPEALVALARGREARSGAVVVEGAGGLLVPLAPGFLVADLAARLGHPLLVVARAGLGTVNHTALTIAEARRRGLRVAGVVLNGDDPEAPTNAALVEQLSAVPVLGVCPRLPGPPDRAGLLRLAGALDMERLLSALAEKEVLHA